MSREYWTFKGESGETAFLAGVVDVLSDTLSLVCDFTSAFDRSEERRVGKECL